MGSSGERPEAGRDLDALRVERKRQQNLAYIRSEGGKASRRAYYETYKARHMESKRVRRAEYVQANPVKVGCRALLRNAVRRGWIVPPQRTRNWHNRWEFHHPDHSRPYYGVWVTPPDHRRIDNGSLACPPCTDYTEHVRERLLSEWGLAALDSVAPREEKDQ